MPPIGGQKFKPARFLTSASHFFSPLAVLVGSRAREPRKAPIVPDSFENLAEATEAALQAASHLTGKDDAAVQALRVLARKIDTDDELREAYLNYQIDRGTENLRPLQLDNVSLPTYLKFCESLGLTPAGRTKLEDAPKEKPGGKLAALQGGAQQRRAG